jgi:choline-sulfatase
MRLLYIDIDSLRPDHLGCYGYHRPTSPNIDRVAADGVRFDNYYVSDAPCLPSRTAMWAGRFGIHTGVVNHGGTAADPFIEGQGRSFSSTLGSTSWMRCLRKLGHKCVTVSPFGERHSAWHWYANFSEIFNTGKGGIETADEIFPVADQWLRRHGREENFFLHINCWDPHTPYRAPDEYYRFFKDEPLPEWYSEDVRRRHWEGVGPHSAREVGGYDDAASAAWPKQPMVIDSMDAARKMFDGYDAGVRYADEYIGRLLNTLADLGVLDETVIIVTADHGENLGELNIYCDHQTADHITSRVPLIVRWPGLHAGAQPSVAPDTASRTDSALHYHLDFAATLIELLGGAVPDNWDGVSFADSFRRSESEAGRDYLVLSQGAWSCQRSVRWDDFLCIRSYHDGYHCFGDHMLFNIREDPHEQHDLAPGRPEMVAQAMKMLDEWQADMMRTASHPTDPMWLVMREGGPYHTCGYLTKYCQRLRSTGRGLWADELLRKHRNECDPVLVK